jgi:nucleotide-binding universal stress UspA family protein
MSDTTRTRTPTDVLPVVVGIDGSPESLAALAWAADQAALTDAPLLTVTALRAGELRLHPGEDVVEAAPTTRKLLTEAVHDTLGEKRAATVDMHLSAGPAARALIDYSAAARLVVVGPHSYSGLPGIMLGSVPQRVVTYAHCPVAVARPTPPDSDPRIVVGLDGSDCARAALYWAIRQARLTDASVEAIVAWDWRAGFGVYPFGPPESEIRAAAERLLETEFDTLPPDRRTHVSGQVVEGKPAAVLTQAASTAQLLVIGSRGAAGGFGHLIGSTGLKCLKHATGTVIATHCPPATI